MLLCSYLQCVSHKSDIVPGESCQVL
ncbi:rCG34270 [Rattus norvegicus]|uniref:RCG34270 n=1 Tax=Rattus norvegicus TaxID=10116 RepID=A6HFK0_RAT|nr:rCG34270 [Rattus norvegicus]